MTHDELDKLAARLSAQEVLTMPGQPFTLAAVQPWLKHNDALRTAAAVALRSCAARHGQLSARIAEIERERDYWKRLAEALLAREEKHRHEEEHKEMMASFYAAIGMRPL